MLYFPARALLSASMLVAGAWASGTEVVYQLDPEHTYPSFESDHFDGASIWRGKFTRSSGTVSLDREARTGTVLATIDMASVSIGNDQLDKELRSDKFFDVQKYPTAQYSGKIRFKGDTPAEVIGTLRMHGVVRTLNLKIVSFKCYQNPLLKREVCGTESTGTFQRDDFGIDYAKQLGFRMKNTLHIQAEGIRQ